MRNRSEGDATEHVNRADPIVFRNSTCEGCGTAESVYWHNRFENATMPSAKNVLGTNLQPCSMKPLTGFYRNGCCDTGPDDVGQHLVCTRVTAEFLAHQRSIGNDLSTPHPLYGFPGLKPGDQWCVCVTRWKQSFEAGMAAPVVLEATHISTLEYVDLDDLKKNAVTQSV
jgi:uncharacterized protein